MALSWNEIKDRALKFTNEWKDETRERAEKDTFWNEFFHVFGISRRRLATFEEPIKKLNKNQGFIDLFWKGTLLVEHKSKGGNLDAAFEQASDYFYGIKEHELPKYILVSDFYNFKLYDLDDNKTYEFTINEFHENIKLFGFIAGYQKRTFKDEDPVNIKAAELMGKLHDQLEESGYEGHPLEVFLVRLLFCLFADDTGIFEKDTFKEFIDIKTDEDGSNLGALLAQFFQVLNTPHDKRLKNLDEHLNAFPYVNGKLFEEPLPISSFNTGMRDILLQCSSLDWGKISPAIFGSMFQSVMNPEERRNLGAHYTSEKNILKLIKPLFLDDLYKEFKAAKKKGTKPLQEFHHKLGTLKFLDPACGSGNFLIITYRELRLLELEILKVLYGNQQVIGINQILHVDVDQFYGIEYDEFPAKIAEVALWLMDHQMNLRISEAFGQYYARLPLKKSATIVHGNALRIDWETVVPKNELNYILGNPPFYGTAYQTKEQKEDMNLIFKQVKGAGNLDYVAGWYLKASYYINKTNINVGLVSTNSITQGEQANILWEELIVNHNIFINQAHRTFIWKNEAKSNAAVHVVIVCFSQKNEKNKTLFEYIDGKGDAIVRKVKSINQYLTSSPIVFLKKRTTPICDVPKIGIGSALLDGGFLILSTEEKKEILLEEPFLESFILKFVSSYEFINNKDRWCFWLKNTEPSILKKSKILKDRLNSIKDFRLSSSRGNTNKMAEFPSLFGEERQPQSDFLIIPKVSSQRRKYLPIGFISKNIIITDKVFALPNASLYSFGILISNFHMQWVINVGGRLKSDFSYSNTIVYNNYPWPKEPSDKNKKDVESKAQKVLDVRLEFPNSSLADLYDPLTMPPKLVKAHQALDKAVDLCYRPQPFVNETTRIEYLFELYNEYTMPLLTSVKKKASK